LHDGHKRFRKREALLVACYFCKPPFFLFTYQHLITLEKSSSLKFRAEAFVFEDISVEEVFFHLIELVAADSVDITSLKLLLEDLGNRNLTQVCAHTEEITIHNESILIVFHLGGEGCLIFLLGRVFLGKSREEVSVSFATHAYIFYNYIIICINYLMDEENKKSPPPD
jgi:hypothetical protein